MADGKAPIIIKRVARHGHEHHGGAWKVAYADMVTALMALFIVLWILGQSDQVIASVSGYFNDPQGFVTDGASRSIEGGSQASEVSVVRSDVPPPPRPTPDPGRKLRDPESGEGEFRRWRDAAREIRDALEATPNYERYRDQIELSVTPEGLRIALVESHEAPLFKPGAQAMNPDARALLAAIGQQISRLPNQLVIEGHTDGRTAGTDDHTNWELSTGRAHTASRALLAGGVHPRRIFEVRGYADRQLYNPLDPTDSRNRRVAVTLLSPDALDVRQQLASEKMIR